MADRSQSVRYWYRPKMHEKRLTASGATLGISLSAGGAILTREAVMTEPEDVTSLLALASDGDRDAVSRLIPILYDELHRIAHGRMRGERTGHTLDTTGLVHEAYLEIAGLDRM